MYIFELIQIVLRNLNLYDFSNYKSILNHDLIVLFDEYYNYHNKSFIYNGKSLIKGLHGSLWIKGTISDNYIPKNRYNLKFIEYLDKLSDEYLKDSKFLEFSYIQGRIGRKSFFSFIKPYLFDKSNYHDYFNRINKDLPTLLKTFDNSFKNDIYKLTLFDIDLNKLNKDYLFFKNDLTIENNIKVSIVKYDEFLKAIPLKSDYHLFKMIENNFFKGTYKKKNYLLNSFIVIVEILDYDKKHNLIYCNKLVYRDLLKTLDLNTIKYKSLRKTKLFKEIQNNKYYFNDIDKKELFLNQIKEFKKELKELDKEYNKNLKRINDLKLKSKYYDLTLKEQQKLDKRLNRNDEIISDIDKIQNDLIDLNNDLIDLDRKQDKFEQNLFDEKQNYSLKLKSYL